MDKHLFGAAAVALNFIGYSIYIRAILTQGARPHLFTWLIWGLVNVIGFAALFVSSAGAGAWAMGSSALFSTIIAALSISRGEKDITRSDWACLVAGLATIPLWALTNDPLGSIILLMLINTFGAIPTFRKSFSSPYGESLPAWTIYSLKGIFILCAIEHYSFRTTALPAVIILGDIGIFAMVLMRRYVFRPRSVAREA